MEAPANESEAAKRVHGFGSANTGEAPTKAIQFGGLTGGTTRITYLSR